MRRFLTASRVELIHRLAKVNVWRKVATSELVAKKAAAWEHYAAACDAGLDQCPIYNLRQQSGSGIAQVIPPHFESPGRTHGCKDSADRAVDVAVEAADGTRVTLLTRYHCQQWVERI